MLRLLESWNADHHTDKTVQHSDAAVEGRCMKE